MPVFCSLLHEQFNGAQLITKSRTTTAWPAVINTLNKIINGNPVMVGSPQRGTCWPQ
jgi:hypothetical protein